MSEKQLAQLAQLARDIALHRSDAEMQASLLPLPLTHLSVVFFFFVSPAGQGFRRRFARGLPLPPADLPPPFTPCPLLPPTPALQTVSNPVRQGASARDLMQPVFALAAAEAAWRSANPARYVSPETVSAVLLAGGQRCRR
jgi:hypothetical protein